MQAAVAFAHGARGQARERERSGQIEVDHAGEGLGGRPQRGGGRAGAGVVDEPVEAAVALHDRGDQALAIGVAGDVARDGVGAGDLPAQRLQALGPPGGEDRHGARGRQRAAQLLAQARARAGDDDDVAVQRGLSHQRSPHNLN